MGEAAGSARRDPRLGGPRTRGCTHAGTFYAQAGQFSSVEKNACVWRNAKVGIPISRQTCENMRFVRMLREQVLTPLTDACVENVKVLPVGPKGALLRIPGL